jgi:hypothetical protein
MSWRERAKRWASSVHWVLSFSYYLHWWLGAAGLVLVVAIWTFVRKHYGAGVFFGVSSIVLAIVVIYARSQKRRWGEFVNPDLDILKYQIVYQLGDGCASVHLVVRARVEARHDGVDHFRHKFRWTGSGKAAFKPIKGISSIDGPTPDKTALFNLCRLNFDQALAKGEIRDFEFHVDAEDPDHKARPFVNKFMNDRLVGPVTLRLILPATIRGNVHKEILSHVGAPNPEKHWEMTPDEFTGDVSWNIPKVKLFKVYQISWAL